jgi:hypothetical protein
VTPSLLIAIASRLPSATVPHLVVLARRDAP